MDTGAESGPEGRLVSPDDLAALTPAQRRLLAALTHYFTPHELAVLTAEDIEFFLSLEHDGLSDLTPLEARQTALAYRNRLRRKRS